MLHHFVTVEYTKIKKICRDATESFWISQISFQQKVLDTYFHFNILKNSLCSQSKGYVDVNNCGVCTFLIKLLFVWGSWLDLSLGRDHLFDWPMEDRRQCLFLWICLVTSHCDNVFCLFFHKLSLKFHLVICSSGAESFSYWDFIIH